MLSGCWTAPIKIETKLELTPDHLMASPCEAMSAKNSVGEYTVDSLARGYVANTQCLYTHQKLLEQQRQYKKQIEGVYGK